MPPKNKQQNKGNKDNKGAVTITDADIDAAVAAITGAANKPGMTKKQIQEAEAKKAKQEQQRLTRERVGYTEDELQAMYRLQQQRLEEERQHVSKFVPIAPEKQGWHPTATGKYVRLEQFDGNTDKLRQVMDLFNRELTEPYVDFTYEHFILGWPDVCLLAYSVPDDNQAPPSADEQGTFVGAIVSNVSRKKPAKPLTGYVAMLAVIPPFRKHKIASLLVKESVTIMKAKKCAVVALETPVDGPAAIGLYLNLGFVKTKFLPRYYIQGQDAVRLKLFLEPPLQSTPEFQDAARQLGGAAAGAAGATAEGEGETPSAAAAAAETDAAASASGVEEVEEPAAADAPKAA